MTKEIIFKAAEEILADKEILPEPASLSVPEWFKKIPRSDNGQLTRLTIKACVPFQDSLMTGYILKNPIDQQINWFVERNGKEDCWVDVNGDLESIRPSASAEALHYNLNTGRETHPIEQLGGAEGGCPFVKQNSFVSFYKIINPFSIILPKGYSALFIPLLNRPDERFTPIGAIVDDGNILPPNFPIIIHKKGSWLLEKGTPIIGLIPFKREDWKMKFEKKTLQETKNYSLSYATKIVNWYRHKVWKKKRWR